MDTADPQARIINHHLGALLVLAPVGTGKTYALIERIAAIIAAGADPRRMLCLTFTNRAAEEVRERLASRFPGGAPPLLVSTFHGLCANIVRREARAAGLPADFTVCDDMDARELMAEILQAPARDARDFHQNLGRIKSALESRQLTWPPDYSAIYASLAGGRHAAERYQTELRTQHQLDFSDLVLCANAILARKAEARQRWQDRFDHVLVDEIQDTHRSEYRVVYVLARRTGNLAFFGDRHQTIYEWRGSDPEAIIQQFKADFAPVTEIELIENRRATRQLVQVASSFAQRSFAPGGPPSVPAGNADDGLPPVWRLADDPMDEGDWIASQIHALSTEPEFQYRRIGVLTGTNGYAKEISSALTARDVPHITVDAYDFFQRAEVKDALAVLRLLVNPNDTAAMHRATRVLVPGDSRGALKRVHRIGEPVGLERVDMLKVESHEFGEPFGRLIDAYRNGRLVVLDVETTGLEANAEVIEIAAARLERGQPVDELHFLVKNRLTVGDSVRTHGLEDDYLAEHGQPPEEVLMAAFEFVGDDLVVGHNIGFDLRVLLGQARRLGLEPPRVSSADTLILARRFLDEQIYSLDGLAQALSLQNRPAHRAQADVATTCELLGMLLPRLEAGAERRRALVDAEGPPFIQLADDLDRWREMARLLRPAELLTLILDESELRQKHARESDRLNHLDELIDLFQHRDMPEQDSWSALDQLVRSAAMIRYVDHLLEERDRVAVLTIHQAKGQEFDTVFIAGLADDELPRWQSLNAGRLKEEQRLFYVALTRARRRLFLSGPRTSNGRVRQVSRFVAQIDPALLVGG
ncbi:MAG: 3'-5' exonuclease [Chloroflexota bacterium]